MTVYSAKRNSIGEIMRNFQESKAKSYNLPIKDDLKIPGIKYSSPMNSLRFESPIYLRRVSRVHSPWPKEFNHKYDRSFIMRSPLILIEGYQMKVRDKCPTPTSQRNTYKLVTKLPLIKFD